MSSGVAFVQRGREEEAHTVQSWEDAKDAAVSD